MDSVRRLACGPVQAAVLASLTRCIAVLCSWLSPWFFQVAEGGRAVDRRSSFGVCFCAALSARCDSSMDMLLHSICPHVSIHTPSPRLHVLKQQGKRARAAGSGRRRRLSPEGRHGAPQDGVYPLPYLAAHLMTKSFPGPWENTKGPQYSSLQGLPAAPRGFCRAGHGPGRGSRLWI